MPADSGKTLGSSLSPCVVEPPWCAKSNLIQTQISEDFISLPDTGESEQGTWELCFTARPVPNHGVLLL